MNKKSALILILTFAILLAGLTTYFVLKIRPQKTTVPTKNYMDITSSTPVLPQSTSTQVISQKSFSETASTIEMGQSATYSLPVCGVSLAVKSTTTERTATIMQAKDGQFDIRIGDSTSTAPTFAVTCMPRIITDFVFSDIATYIGMNGGPPSIVNPDDYGIFDQQTLPYIPKLYLETEKPFAPGSVELGFQSKSWLYDFYFTNPEQATNQNSFIISVSPNDVGSVYCQERKEFASDKPTISNTDYSDVLVVENTNSSSSVAIGNYFVSKRNIPTVNIAHIKTSTEEEINDAEFQDLRSQIESYISANDLENKIDYIVTTKGVPLKVARSGSDVSLENPSAMTSNQGSASVDSELTLIFSSASSSIGQAGPVQSPYYFENYLTLTPFSRAKYGIYLVTRLDGYTVPEVEKIIDETSTPVPFSSSTKFVFDEGPSKYFDLNDEMTNIAGGLQSCGFDVVDTTSTYLTNQQDVIGYVSFGSNDPTAASTTVNADPQNTWHAGAIAVTFVSTSARSFNWPSIYGQSLIADVIAEGATGAEGYTYEPYTSAMPNLTTLFTAYTSGYNLAESFYAASPYLSWMGVVIGDPKATIVVAD